MHAQTHRGTENQECEELPLPDRGTIEYSNNLTIGSQAMYINFECEQNYEKSGDLTLKCTESGWEGQPPTCSKCHYSICCETFINCIIIILML